MATKINVTRCAKRNDATALSSVTCNSATAGAAQDYTLTVRMTTPELLSTTQVRRISP